VAAYVTSAALPPATRARVEEEMADVLLYLTRLAGKLDGDLVEAAKRKLKANAERYPVEKARGRRAKYAGM
jgi:dCTP diphosphatase